MPIPESGTNCLDALFRAILRTLGYKISPNPCQDKLCILELMLATLYFIISLATFRAVGPPVVFLGLIWGIQVFLSLFRSRREEQDKSTQLIRRYRLDDTTQVNPPSDRRLLLIEVLFVGLLILFAWYHYMVPPGVASTTSVTVWDWLCSIIYICAYVDQMIGILINFYGAEMDFPVILVPVGPNGSG